MTKPLSIVDPRVADYHQFLTALHSDDTSSTVSRIVKFDIGVGKTSAANVPVDIGNIEPAVFFTSNDDLETNEDGDTAIISLRLTTAPLRDVTITFTSSDTTEDTVSPSALTFSPVNWSTPQSFTVTGQNDYLTDGKQSTPRRCYDK